MVMFKITVPSISIKFGETTTFRNIRASKSKFNFDVSKGRRYTGRNLKKGVNYSIFSN